MSDSPRKRPPKRGGQRPPRRDVPAERVPPPADPTSPWVQVRSGTRHPFIYRRMIAGSDKAAIPGDVVSVYDKQGDFFGRGFYNPNSEIVLRMLTHSDEPIDEAFWQQRIAQAVALRRQLRLDEGTDAYRLVHAEGDGLSGLIVERYADVLAFELFSLGMERQLDTLIAAFENVLGPPASLDRPDRAAEQWRLVIRADQRVQKREGFRLETAADVESVVIREHGVRYRVDLRGGHKTGFFCDQRDNRKAFAALCRDADVLDCCSYTAGFGLCAKLLGGAADVTSVDLDEAALAVARDNANLNQTRLNLVHADAFTYLRQMSANGRQYDAVVLDPPKLALTRPDIDEALGKYYDLNVLALQTVRPGGVFLTCSCSGLVSPEQFEQAVIRAARRCDRNLQVFNRTGAAADHPVLMNCPDSAYLKALWCRVL